MTPLDALLLSGALTLYCASLAVLGFGARLWADAAAAAHRARAHGIEADMQRDTIEQARAAAERVMGQPLREGQRLSEEDIRQSLLEQRMAGRENGQTERYEEYTTSGDVTPDELNTHLQGGEFRQPTT